MFFFGIPGFGLFVSTGSAQKQTEPHKHTHTYRQILIKFRWLCTIYISIWIFFLNWYRMVGCAPVDCVGMVNTSGIHGLLSGWSNKKKMKNFWRKKNPKKEDVSRWPISASTAQWRNSTSNPLFMQTIKAHWDVLMIGLSQFRITEPRLFDATAQQLPSSNLLITWPQMIARSKLVNECDRSHRSCSPYFIRMECCLRLRCAHHIWIWMRS